MKRENWIVYDNIHVSGYVTLVYGSYLFFVCITCLSWKACNWSFVISSMKYEVGILEMLSKTPQVLSSLLFIWYKKKKKKRHIPSCLYHFDITGRLFLLVFNSSLCYSSICTRICLVNVGPHATMEDFYKGNSYWSNPSAREFTPLCFIAYLMCCFCIYRLILGGNQPILKVFHTHAGHNWVMFIFAIQFFYSFTYLVITRENLNVYLFICFFLYFYLFIYFLLFHFVFIFLFFVFNMPFLTFSYFLFLICRFFHFLIRGHSWLFVVTRDHSWSLVVIRGHSWSLVCTFSLVL